MPKEAESTNSRRPEHTTTRDKQKMTSLSQYPAEEEITNEAVLQSSTLVSLKVATLFVTLEEVQHRGTQDIALVIPMTLPTSCRDVSLGIAAKAAQLDIENGKIHLPGGTQPTFLVAARDGYAQRNPETGLPAGFVPNVISLVNDKTTDATLLTPACHMFSKKTQTNNLRAKPLKVEHLGEINSVIERQLSEEHGLEIVRLELDENPSKHPLQLFVELLHLLQRLVDNGTTMQETYHIISEVNPEATSRFKSTNACRKLDLRLKESNDNDVTIVTEQCYWLALSLLLQQVSPVFISPVSSTHKCMAAILSNSGLKHNTGKFPFLYVTGEAAPRPPTSPLVVPGAMKLMTAVFAPVEDSAGSLDSVVRYLYQKSLDTAETVGSLDGSFEDTHRILDLLRVCQVKGEGFSDVSGLTQSLMKEQSSNVRGCYEKRLRVMMSILHRRRPALFLLVLKYLGLRSTWRSGQHLSRQSIIDRIGNLTSDSGMTLESSLKLVLTPPGTNPSAEWDEETKTIKSIHDLEYFRPSGRYLASGLVSESDEYAPSQSNQEETIDHEKESIRITLFSDAWLKSTWFFLDCIVQTSQHAQKVSALISRQYQSSDSSVPPWDPKVMFDFVQMFWLTSYFINSHIRQTPTLVDNRLGREEAKSIAKGVFHGMLPYMLIELVEKHGMTNKATEGFRGVIKKFPSNSQFAKVEVFGIASLAMYQRSKTPAVIGGSDFYDGCIAPAVNNFLNTVMEITGAEKVGKCATENTREVALVLKKMEMGELVIPNIVEVLYRQTVTELPSSVDRLRSGVTDTVTTRRKSKSKRKPKMPETLDDNDAADETPPNPMAGASTHITGATGGVSNVSNTTGNGNGNHAELVKKIHSYLDTLTDARYQYSPRTILLQIAMVTEYANVDELRDLFKRSGMESQSGDESGSDDEMRYERRRRRVTYHGDSMISEEAGEESVSEDEMRYERRRRVTYHGDSMISEEAGEESFSEEEEEDENKVEEEDSSTSDDDVPLSEWGQQRSEKMRSVQKANKDSNKRHNKIRIAPKQQRRGRLPNSDEDVGSSDDENTAIAQSRVQQIKRRRIEESESESESENHY